MSRGRLISINCKNCKKERQIRKADFNRGRGKFCSKSCSAKYNFSGENNPNWQGGKPPCKDCGKKLTHYGTKQCRNCYLKSDSKKAVSGKNHYKWNGGKPNCKDCDKEIDYGTDRCNDCWGLSLSGESHPNWKGGTTPLNRKLRNTKKYKTWRTQVFERDNYTCQECGVRGGDLEANHIKRFWDFPELRYEVGNGITLCKPCHNLTKGKEETFEDRFFEVTGFALNN